MDFDAVLTFPAIHPSSRLPMRNRQTPSILLCIWVVNWLLVVPLFHVHADAAHHHHESGPHHGGIAHTVFSKDLDGEFGDRTTGLQDAGVLSAHSSCSFQDSPEIGFALLSDDSKRKLFKCLSSSLAIFALGTLSFHVSSDSATTEERRSAPPFLALSVSPRAPPAILP